MNFDPGIICFEHCHCSIFCQSLPELCPICHKNLTAGKTIPFRLPYPFVRANQKPCSILMKSSNGNFLSCYSMNNANLHIGITSSTAIVVEYDTEGLSESNTDSWNECVVVYELGAASWYKRWDAVLKDVADNRCFSSERYDENTFNCYSFALAFVQHLQHEELKQSCASKEKFCEDFILPRLIEAFRYIKLYRKITSDGIFIQSQKS